VADTIAPDALAALVAEHRRFLGFLERRVGNRAAAEELLQTAYVRSIERGGDLRDAESAVAWFYRLLRNALTDFYRHRAAEHRALERQAAETSSAVIDDPELEAAVCACVHGLIPTLKEDYAGILRAVEMEGHSLGRVAEQLKITPGNAAVRLHRARRALRERLHTACGTCTEHGCLDCTCQGTTHQKPH
jgi:RNA polymerase sigma-70 factor (ECF subfamily)